MSQASLGYTDTGQIINLVTNDVRKLEEVRTCLTVNAFVLFKIFRHQMVPAVYKRLSRSNPNDVIEPTELKISEFTESGLCHRPLTIRKVCELWWDCLFLRESNSQFWRFYLYFGIC
jgi:hypothetical protein